MEMHSSSYCDLISWITPTCFSTFYRCVMVPTLVENSKFSVYLLLLGPRHIQPSIYIHQCGNLPMGHVQIVLALASEMIHIQAVHGQVQVV